MNTYVTWFIEDEKNAPIYLTPRSNYFHVYISRFIVYMTERNVCRRSI